MKFKRSYKGNNHEGFLLKDTQIGNRSIAHNRIELPYTGRLPKGIEQHDSASISIIISPAKASAMLILRDERKKYKHSLDATPQELDNIAWNLFFKDCKDDKTGQRWSETRFDNGLGKYWLGYLQAEWMEWRQITFSPDRLSDDCIEAILKKVSTSRLEELLERRRA